MILIQDLVHKFEEVSQSRWLRVTLACLGVVALGVVYDLHGYKNMATQEAMDAAQLGRNIAEGKGYTTLFVRPFSMYLIKRKNREKSESLPQGETADYSRIKGGHPDISNPPAYPLLLAGLMKVLPFDYKIIKGEPFWSSGDRFLRYQPDFLIAVFNELLFAAMVVVAFFWARRLFDAAVAWTSAALLLVTEVLWRFNVSGLSTILLILIFMGLIWCLTLLEEEAREPKRGASVLFILAALSGALIGVGGLTRYSFAWLIIPAVVFLILFSGPRRVALSMIAFATFALVITPWIVRNYSLSGTAFGTATYSALEGTSLFPEYRLERSLDPTIRVSIIPVWIKLLTNLRGIFEKNLFDMGGGWITALFLVGLLVGFRNATIRRLRYFLLMSLGLLIVVQAMGRTELSEDSPLINSENLLVLFIPVVLIYGVSFFYALLDQINLPIRELRFVVIGLFGVLVSLPMIFALLPPKTYPVAYPPYFPPAIQQTSSWLKENELMMSDVPWAVAWYGNRQCVWLTLYATANPSDPDSNENFFTINDYQKTINALYLTPRTLDDRFLSDWIRAGEQSWGSFVIETVIRRKYPPGFPLRSAPSGFLPEQLFLADWQRW